MNTFMQNKEEKTHLRSTAPPGVENHEIAVGLEHGREPSVYGRDAPTHSKELVHTKDIIFSP